MSWNGGSLWCVVVGMREFGHVLCGRCSSASIVLVVCSRMQNISQYPLNILEMSYHVSQLDGLFLFVFGERQS